MDPGEGVGKELESFSGSIQDTLAYISNHASFKITCCPGEWFEKSK